MAVFAAMRERKPSWIGEANGAPWMTSATRASASSVRAPTPGTASSSWKSRGPAVPLRRVMAQR
jgi:hypothetical protein